MVARAPAGYEGVVEEFHRELAELRRRCAGRPGLELTWLLLLALERERLVAVAYQDGSLLGHLARLALDPQQAALYRFALGWIGQDEDQHAIWTRGALLRRRGPRLKIWGTWLQGSLGGWSAAVSQHAAWGEAFWAKLGATALTQVGGLLGKVPRAVKKHLAAASFGDFCRFHIAAEETAALGWDRAAALVAEDPEAPPVWSALFGRIAGEEQRHGRVFALLAEGLDAQDRPLWGADEVAERIREVDPAFLPRARRGGVDNPLGAGAAVHVGAGGQGSGETAEEVLGRVLGGVDLEGLVRARAAATGRALGTVRAVVKANFMMGYHAAEPSPMVRPALVAALARALRAAGCGEVRVLEAPNLYDRYYAGRGVGEVARRFGFEDPSYTLVDVGQDQVPCPYPRGLGQETLSRAWWEADLRVSFGKMRSHPNDIVYLTLSNLEGLGARHDDFLFEERLASRHAALMMILDVAPPHLGVLDAWSDVADGLVGILGSARPKQPRRLYASRDALALDLVAGRHMGLTDPDRAQSLAMARRWFGLSEAQPQVVGEDRALERWRDPQYDARGAIMAALGEPAYLFFSQRGFLLSPCMDLRAFPPLRPEPRLLAATHALTRRLLGLHLSARRRALPPAP